MNASNATEPTIDPTSTHEVLNQPPLMPTRDVFADDAALSEALTRHGGGAHADRLHELGRRAGLPEWRALGTEANRDLPRLASHDRHGNRLDEVQYNPAWHDMMRSSVEWGLHADPWQSDEKGAHVARAAGFIIWTQVEPGHLCPISMTYASVAALSTDPDLAALWTPRLAARSYDFGLRAPSTKRGLIAGMAMTEKQGGSDVRANTTQAVPQSDGSYRLTGHKWFVSAPMSDVFLVLAQAPGGLTCFLLPRVLEDGTRNTFRIQRLKDKLGNRSNASSEVELANTYAERLGDEGRGVRTIVEMVSATRLDCVLGAAGLMRGAVSAATWHVSHRAAFGETLVDQPLMRNVLADLAVEVEATIALGMRLAAAVDAAQAGDQSEAMLRRIALPAAKFWSTKRSIAVAAEALECLGGPGYVEDSGMPLIYREAPVNSVWEGSGNVNSLDLLRAMAKEPGSVDALLLELGKASGADSRYDAAVADLLTQFSDLSDLEYRSRGLASRIAVLLQGAQLLQYGPDAVADAFVATRIAGDGGTQFGTLPRGLDVDAIIDRVLLAST
ncbi:MAG: acyl-CoA dehydrogenase family protein [Candidatus Nanopelagicales bacterium]|nr:acyl-CoA dehydrogenase family protein [Candidatus Nanopelagicales bacterium]MDZ4250448.1 acyl-CoA dehydrogenase family protein [Candidatus Nanopelagicales bacterium]